MNLSHGQKVERKVSLKSKIQNREPLTGYREQGTSRTYSNHALPLEPSENRAGNISPLLGNSELTVYKPNSVESSIGSFIQNAIFATPFTQKES